MIAPRLFLCNGASEGDATEVVEGSKAIHLDSNPHSPTPNVTIQIEDIARITENHMSPRLLDLLEIASYVYSADCATNRGSQWTDNASTESWERSFKFVIGVRDLDFWSSVDVCESLERMLTFLSNDRYDFQFIQIGTERPQQEYFHFSDREEWPFYDIDRVVLFSGGLDSLAGALTAVDSNERVALVSHRPVATIGKRQRDLHNQIVQKYPGLTTHIPVWINKDVSLGREHTQRTRSFLYSALGATVAHSIRAKGVRFYENGVISLNFPVADEALRSRASRTTHPQTLQMYSTFYSKVLGRDLQVDNPFIFKTKTDVVKIIADLGGANLIPYSTSCAHTIYKSASQQHCGTCSQCIDRRIAIYSAKLETYDPSTDYEIDVFTGRRKDGYERNMAVNYIRHGFELQRMDDSQLAAQFALEIPRATRALGGGPKVAENLIRMHKRHGDSVFTVILQEMREHVSELINGELEDSSLLSLVYGRSHLVDSWERYANRIVEILTVGVPLACESNHPKTEPALQKICDGILKPHDLDLIREFPFMRWSYAATKPDWSSEELLLWVELKYVRQKSDIRNITEDIAADITKYTDNSRNIIFVVYDPHHLITDELTFKVDVERHAGFIVSIIR